MKQHRVTDCRALYRSVYRIPYAQLNEMEKQVDELLDRDIIVHSTYPCGDQHCWFGNATVRPGSSSSTRA